jgi:hypothetical protein
MGQTRPVTAIKLMIKDSIEMKLDEIQKKKANLAQLSLKNMTRKELMAQKASLTSCSILTTYFSPSGPRFHSAAMGVPGIWLIIIRLRSWRACSDDTIKIYLYKHTGLGTEEPHRGRQLRWAAHLWIVTAGCERRLDM